MRHENGYDAVSEQIYLGRYPLTLAQFPDDASVIVDMTSEFNARVSLFRDGNRMYFCEPCLDQMMPDAPTILRLAEKVAKLLDNEKAMKAYVHCANGRGRSSSLVVLIMLIRGQVKTVEKGLTSSAKIVRK